MGHKKATTFRHSNFIVLTHKCLVIEEIVIGFDDINERINKYIIFPCKDDDNMTLIEDKVGMADKKNGINTTDMGVDGKMRKSIYTL